MKKESLFFPLFFMLLIALAWGASTLKTPNWHAEKKSPKNESQRGLSALVQKNDIEKAAEVDTQVNAQEVKNQDEDEDEVMNELVIEPIEIEE